MGVTGDSALPDADYVVLASRLALDLDGGFAVAVPLRIGLLESAGAVRPPLLTLDAGSPETHTAQREQYVRRGMVASADRMRNLFDEAVADPTWLHDAAEPGEATPGVPYRTVTDAAGSPILSIPVLPADPPWHLTDTAIVVHAAVGDRVLRGWGALYIAWLDHVAAQYRDAASDPNRLFVVICESRQTGELLAGWDDPRVRVVHEVHNSHLPAPYDDPDAPLDGLWKRWLALLDRFDAVIWPTATQRADVTARFGRHEGFVLNNPVEVDSDPVWVEERDARLVVMMNRLADQKRVDRGLRAWERVVAAVPDARLDVWGDGPLRDELAALIDELGIGDSVTLRGRAEGTREIFDRAALLVTSSAFEGQSVAFNEALARGLPVVSFDVRYGPRDVIGEGGVLVPPGDTDALGDAIIGVLTDDERRAQLSAGALRAAAALSHDLVRAQLVDALRSAVERPSRRAVPPS